MKDYFQSYNTYFVNEVKKYSAGIRETHVAKTHAHILETLKSLFRINENTIAFLGSAGKKKDKTAYNHNLNVAVDVTVLSKKNKLEEDEVIPFIKAELKREGIKCEEKDNDLILEWPIIGSRKKETVNLQFQLTENLEWVKFARYSPDLKLKESEYVGKYREAVLHATAKVAKKEVKSYFNTNEMVKEYEVYYFDAKEGLGIVTKSFEAKNGVLKKALILEDSKQIYSDKPDDVVKILFGESFTAEDISTFEKCLETIDSKKFAYPKKRKYLKKKITQEIVGFNLTVPEGIM